MTNLFIYDHHFYNGVAIGVCSHIWAVKLMKQRWNFRLYKLPLLVLGYGLVIHMIGNFSRTHPLKNFRKKEKSFEEKYRQDLTINTGKFLEDKSPEIKEVYKTLPF